MGVQSVGIARQRPASHPHPNPPRKGEGLQAFVASLGTLAALLLAATPAQAAPVDPAAYAQLHWRSIGPFRGGRVLAVAGVPGERLHFYMGGVNGGVWETRDAGRTWTPISNDIPAGSIGAIAVAPSAPATVYVGTGESDMRSDIAQGVGMFASHDAGAHWAAIGLSDTQQIARIIVDPRDPNTVLVAALGHPYGPNAERGVFRSADGGRSWTKTLFRDADTGAIDLAVKPGDPDTVYAALWSTRRPPWNTYPPSSGPGGGLFKSADGGRTWKALTGLPMNPGRMGIAVSPAAPNRVYALVDAADGGLFRSDDGGASWAHVSSDPRIYGRGWYFGELTVEPRDPDRIHVMNTVVLDSVDGGRTFVPVKGDPSGDDFHSMWIDPADPGRRILGVDQGALVSLNGGKTWSSWFNQPTGQFYHVSTDNRFPYRVYGAQQDSGAAGVASRSWGADGVDIEQFHEVTTGGESDNIAPDPDDPDIVYGGRVDKLDLKSGQTRNVDPTLAFPGRYRGEWTLPLVFGRRDHALYFANQRIFRTTDGGARWTPISPDLTRPNPEVPPTLNAATAVDSAEPGARRGVVYAIGPSPVAAGDLWAGTDDGLVWRTQDGGAHWADVTPNGLPAWSKIGTVEPSHFSPAVAYIAVDRHRVDDSAPYIYRTRDGGRSWTPVVSGLADGGTLNSVNVVREDPRKPGLLYAGTERGAYVSFDDGARWQPLKSGLPRTSVRDIEVHGDDLVIATHGRGFYILDDVAALRELAADARPGPRLFAPAPAVRARPLGFTGTPKPKDEPMAANPPDGAYIDYVLAGAPRTPLEIAVYDAAGSLVRRFSSADAAPAPDPAKLKFAPEWLVVPQPPAATPGAHRFVWSLRYAEPKGLSEDGSGGVWARPGRYTVALTIDGQTLRRPLIVAPDPRVRLPGQAYERQFALARRIEADRARAHDALEAAKARHAALLAGAPTKPALAEMDAALQTLADIPADDPRVTIPPDPKSLTSLAALGDRLAGLQAAVDGADADPGADALSGYAQADAALGDTLARWAALDARIGAALGPLANGASR